MCNSTAIKELLHRENNLLLIARQCACLEGAEFFDQSESCIFKKVRVSNHKNADILLLASRILPSFLFEEYSFVTSLLRDIAFHYLNRVQKK